MVDEFGHREVNTLPLEVIDSISDYILPIAKVYWKNVRKITETQYGMNYVRMQFHFGFAHIF